MRRSRPLRGRHGRHDLGLRSRKGEAGGGLCLTVASGHLLHPTETASGTIAPSGRAPRWAQRGRPEAPGSLPLRGLPRGCRAGALAVRPPWDAPRSAASAPSAAPAPPAAHVGPAMILWCVRPHAHVPTAAGLREDGAGPVRSRLCPGPARGTRCCLTRARRPEERPRLSSRRSQQEALFSPFRPVLHIRRQAQGGRGPRPWSQNLS